MENQAVGSRTKHIDIRMHHIREMMQGPDPRMRVMFTRSESNFADVLTKNVTEQTFTQLVPGLKNGDIAEVIFETVDREDVKKSGCRTNDRACRSSESHRYSTVVSTAEKCSGDYNHDLVDDTGWTVVNYKAGKPRMKGFSREKKKGHGVEARKGKEAEVT